LVYSLNPGEKSSYTNVININARVAGCILACLFVYAPLLSFGSIKLLIVNPKRYSFVIKAINNLAADTI